MSCIKTGFHAHVAPHDCWIYGDAFELAGVYYFRICETSPEPIMDRKHFTIKDWQHWFDESKTSQTQNSTMICSPFEVESHGYDGVPC